MAFDLEGYVPVADRITAWFDRYPDGRIVADPPQLHQIGDRYFVGSTARAYRSVDDLQPCQGSAWEPFPGPTQFTRDSEAQNAETSAVGRALALAGIEVKRGFASREEVRNRQPDPTPEVLSISTTQHAGLLARIAALPEDVRDRCRPLVKAAGRLEMLPSDRYEEAVAFVELVEMETADGGAFE